ncbi:hypothetical protein FNJ84_12370 [Paracoccus sp. M683]|uniref:hypothetical protein n=1 Tax=Paracoccus sp. M683 TaxID=2594268 RepID=UPI00117CC5AC|nr:hypothetical protein [Paracoccus sp. M683]TRW96849.1 hypothetical protein FNJ84_12370 [Paracoccus sp. M683]
MNFVNQSVFDDPDNFRRAQGVDINRKTAITDPRGRVLAYAQTGGIMMPARHELRPGTEVFRFGNSGAGAAKVAAGSWWIDRKGLDQIIRFGEVWDLSVGMAMRMLCLVPPEWSDATLLVRARVREPLLAWRGIGNSVVTPAQDGGPHVRMPHQNDIASRRLHQLFIPGLFNDASVRSALQLEQSYPLDKEAGVRGWLYF